MALTDVALSEIRDTLKQSAELAVYAEALQANGYGEFVAALGALTDAATDLLAEVEQLRDDVCNLETATNRETLIAKQAYRIVECLLAELERMRPLAAITQNADSHTDVQPTIEMLRAEVDELAAALTGEHEHPPEYELVQIGGIALNWLRKLGVLPPPRRDLVADAKLGAAVRKLSMAEWFESGPGGPCLVYCFDWRGEDCPEGSTECEDDCDERCVAHPVLLGWAVTDIYYAEGVPEYITWHATPDAALAAAGLMEAEEADNAE